MSAIQTEEEKLEVKEWFERAFLTKEGPFPISFSYRGQKTVSLNGSWKKDWLKGSSEPGSRRYTLFLTEQETGLQCRCEITAFDDFPAVEWVVYLKNTGSVDTPIIADIQPLDTSFPVANNQSCCIHYAKGSNATIDDFEPLDMLLNQGSEFQLASRLGRSSYGTLPFFNLEIGNAGIIGAIGWTGDWAVRFNQSENGKVHICAGMKKTHLKLFPGEEIRTPRILLLFWKEDSIHGHNMLRQFILKYHTPHPSGNLLKGPVCNLSWGENMDYQQIAKARWYKDNNIQLDYFWIDAGWFGDGAFKEDSNLYNSDWRKRVGSWWPNKTTYPNGFKVIGDALKKMGFGFLLWFEPERVSKDSYYAKKHPEWLLGPIGDNYLFNLGIPEARQNITNIVSSLISECGISYRQDFNMDPAPFWEAADTPDRIGMSEIRHIEGLYAFWDTLMTRHPGLFIDNCSSGGRRIDLETISRSIPLWRSDFQCKDDFDPIGMQGQTHGLSLWVPLHAGVCDTANTYHFRSAIGTGIVINITMFERDKPNSKFPVEWLRRMVKEEYEIRKYFYGNFYPLLSFSLADDCWAAWQFDRPDLNGGIVLALRRQKSPFIQMKAYLHKLVPDAQYNLYSIDGGAPVQATGCKLMEKGFNIKISKMPGSALFIYERVG